MVSDSFNDQIEQLLAEGECGARTREGSAFDAIYETESRQVALFGAGNLGRKTLAGLRKIGIDPVCFLDNDSRRWGTLIDELPVFSPHDALQRFRDCLVLVTIWGALGKDRMNARIQSLKEMGFAHVYSFVPLYWKFPEVFLPHYSVDLPHHVHQNASEVKRAFQLMSDETSREEFVAQLRFRLLADFQVLPDPVKGPIYFQKSLFSLRPDDVFVDCGAFDGDTLDLFIRQSEGRFKSVVAFEPDPSNYEKLSLLATRLPKVVQDRIALYNAATGEANSKVKMSVGAGPSSQVGAGDFEIDCVALDSALRGISPTIIKMDIEGWEVPTLLGARETIGSYSPVMAVSTYHRQNDLWAIPLLLHDLSSDYSIYLRPHDVEGWDLVCYAISPERRMP